MRKKLTSLSLVVNDILPSAGTLFSNVKAVAKNLGVKFDSDLKLERRTTKLVQSCFYHMRNIAKLDPSIVYTECKALLPGIKPKLINFFKILLTSKPCTLLHFRPF